jgi:sugar phosphate isomerase/epimerase
MQPNRRTFLGILGGVAAQAVLPSFARAHRAMRPGVQLYTLRSALAQDFDATLARVAGIGYREVEFAGYFNRTPADVRAVLAKHGLSAPSTHLSYGELQNNWSAAVERAVATGHAFVTIPSLPGNARRTLDDYRRVADAFNAGAAEARKAGLGFAYHNHQYEFAPLEGVVPHALLLERTDPALVSFQLDVYWAYHAGVDPVQYVQQHGKRISMLHLKDSGGAPQHAMRAVGSGVINFPRLLAEAQLAGVAHAFVEHDNPTDAIASIEDSYRYLTQLTK